MPGSAGVAEWRGTGLQSRLHGFESRHPLQLGLDGSGLVWSGLVCGGGSTGPFGTSLHERGRMGPLQ